MNIKRFKELRKHNKLKVKHVYKLIDKYVKYYTNKRLTMAQDIHAKDELRKGAQLLGLDSKILQDYIASEIMEAKNA